MDMNRLRKLSGLNEAGDENVKISEDLQRNLDEEFGEMNFEVDFKTQGNHTLHELYCNRLLFGTFTRVAGSTKIIKWEGALTMKHNVGLVNLIIESVEYAVGNKR